MLGEHVGIDITFTASCGYGHGSIHGLLLFVVKAKKP